MDMPVSFGTDGIRGRAFEEITVDLAYRLGRAVAIVFSVPVFVGYDTRESSPQLAAAVLAGLSDGGATAVNLGYFTTPGVAVIAQQRGGVGVVVSASHNPYYDNGLKVLGLGGTKLDHATEDAVAARPQRGGPGTGWTSFEEPPIDESAEHDYAAHLRSMVPSDLSSLHIVIDCANGAASHVAYELFARHRRATDDAARHSPTAATSTRAAARPTPKTWSRTCSSWAPTSASPLTATPIA